MKPQKISTHSAYSDNCYFHYFYRFTKFFFKHLLKVSVFHLEKQKKYIPNKKNIFLGRCQYQNKKALFTDPILSEGFDQMGIQI